MDIPSKTPNPASLPERSLPARTRIPMSVPQQKLAVPEIPGYHLHWMLGTEARLARARQGGYTFVEDHEVGVLSHGLANDSLGSGSTDMGSRVSVVAGGDTDAGGQAVRLILMKIKQEWWEEDQKNLEKSSDALVAALRAGQIGVGEGGELPEDQKHRYVDPSRSTMFEKRRA